MCEVYGLLARISCSAATFLVLVTHTNVTHLAPFKIWSTCNLDVSYGYNLISIYFDRFCRPS